MFMDNKYISISSAHVSDAGALAHIHEEAWRYAYFGIIPGLDLERYLANKGPGWWQTFLSHRPDILVIRYSTNVVGYATLGHIRSRSLPYKAEISELYLHPNYHGLGFGKKLFQTARNKLKNYGLKSLFIWALEENSYAIDFYQRMGGQIVAQKLESFGNSELNKIGFGWDR